MALDIIIAVVLLGLIALVASIGLIVGVVKSYTKLRPDGIVWTLASLVFVLINKIFLESKVLAKAKAYLPMPANIVNFLNAMLVLTILAFVIVLIFAILALILKVSSCARARKAAKVERLEEEGEEVVFNENKEYKKLPLKGKKVTRIINRVFGALSGAINAVVVTLTLIAMTMMVLYVTPLSRGVLSMVYTQGIMGLAWSFIQKYAFDFFIIGFVIYMIRKGWKVGFLEGLRKLVAFIGYLAALVGPFVLMFTVPTAEGGAFAFLGNFAALLASVLGGVTKGLVTGMVANIVGRVVVGFALMLFFLAMMTGFNWLMKKFVDLVDDVKVLSAIEKTLATILFFVFALAIIFVLMSIMYTLTYYGTLDCTVFFRPYSPITSALYGGCDQWLKPIFEKVAELLSQLA